jgi:hypothetical protein
MEKVWVVELKTWQLRLMYAIDAREATLIGDYVLAPVGGYDPPVPRPQPEGTPQTRVA